MDDLDLLLELEQRDLDLFNEVRQIQADRDNLLAHIEANAPYLLQVAGEASEESLKRIEKYFQELLN